MMNGPCRGSDEVFLCIRDFSSKAIADTKQDAFSIKVRKILTIVNKNSQISN